jgi:hypothetical protein
MNSTFGYDARLARALLFAGVAGIASLCGSQLGNAAPTKSPHAANDYAAIFPRKADLSGNLLPSKIGVFKLDASREIEIPVQIPSVCFFWRSRCPFLRGGLG